MGLIQHDVVVATLYDSMDGAVKSIIGVRDAMPDEYKPYLVGPIKGINGFVTFILTPDGSKEGWGPSEDMNGWRDLFIDTLERENDISHGCIRWFHVRYGENLDGLIIEGQSA